MRVAAAFGLACLALACTIPPTEGEVEDELRGIAKEVHPPGELRVVALYASSRMDAWGQRMEAVSEGQDWSSQQARRLARAFNQAARRRVAVVAGGPYGDLNERVVLDALDEVKSARLPGLTLVFVSPMPPSADVRQAVSRRGSALVYRASIRR